MPCKILDNANFTYILYRRSTSDDYWALKRICDTLAHDSHPCTDIIIDFADSKGIVSTEIGLLIRLLRKLKGSACALRLIVSTSVRTVLESTNIDKLPNIALYDSKQEFFSQIKRPLTSAAS